MYNCNQPQQNMSHFIRTQTEVISAVGCEGYNLPVCSNVPDASEDVLRSLPEESDLALPLVATVS